jgi:hypothetical protein
VTAVKTIFDEEDDTVTDTRAGMTRTRLRSMPGLLAAMTLAEKASQLTQYFYLGAPDAVVGPVPQKPGEIEVALSRGEVGSLLSVTDPSEITRLQRLAIEGSRLGIPVTTWPGPSRTRDASLSKAFKREFGIAPGECRRRRASLTVSPSPE